MASTSTLALALTLVRRSRLPCNSSPALFFQSKRFSWKIDSLQQLRFRTLATVTAGRSATFSWNDALQIGQEAFDDGDDDRPCIRDYLNKVRICNRGSEMRSEFLPFIIEDQVAGYVHKGFADHLTKFQDVFLLLSDNHLNLGDGDYITLHPSLKSPHDRTEAVGDVIKCLGEGIIPGIRNELYPVTSAFGMPIFFSLERAAAPYFGIKAYGVHMNGYVDRDGEKFLWLGKRSDLKPTYPGMLDHLVAGGMPYGITCKEALLKECEEEAGISKAISNAAIPVGAVSYVDIEGYRYKRDVLFCYDLQLPDGFIPNNQDGEVGSFKLIPVAQVANIIRRTEFFKPNCALVIIDFLFRHGYVSPEELGYLELLQSLRSGDCS